MLTSSPPASCHLLTALLKGWKFGNPTSARGHQAPTAGVRSLGFCRRQGKPKYSMGLIRNCCQLKPVGMLSILLSRPLELHMGLRSQLRLSRALVAPGRQENREGVEIRTHPSCSLAPMQQTRLQRTEGVLNAAAEGRQSIPQLQTYKRSLFLKSFLGKQLHYFFVWSSQSSPKSCIQLREGKKKNTGLLKMMKDTLTVSF